MHSTESVSTRSATGKCHLRLVGTDTRQLMPNNQTLPDVSPPNSTEVRQLTHAMMNRLWIPHATTIVGLLDVGLSATNFEELSKWIARQLAITTDETTANNLPHLERRFRRAVERFPEL